MEYVQRHFDNATETRDGWIVSTGTLGRPDDAIEIPGPAEQTVEQLKADLEEKKRILDEERLRLERVNKQIVSEFEGYKTDAVKLRDELKASLTTVTEQSTQTTAALEKVQAQLKQCETDRAAEKTRADALTAKNAALEAELSTLTTQIGELQTNIAARETTIAQQQQEIQAKTSELGATKAALTQQGKSEAVSEELRRQIAELTRKTATCDQALGELKTQLQVAKRENQTIKRDLAKAQKDLSDANAATKSAKDATRIAESRYAAITTDLSQAKGETLAATTRIQEIQLDLDLAKKQRDAAERELAAKKAELETATGKIEDQSGVIEEWKTHADEAGDALVSVTKQKDTLEAELKRKNARITQFQINEAAAEQARQKLTANVSELQQELREKERALAELTAKKIAETAPSAITDIQRQLLEATGQITDLQAKLTEAGERNAALEKRLSEITAQVEKDVQSRVALQEERDTAQAAVQALTEELKGAKEPVAAPQAVSMPSPTAEISVTRSENISGLIALLTDGRNHPIDILTYSKGVDVFDLSSVSEDMLKMRKTGTKALKDTITVHVYTRQAKPVPVVRGWWTRYGARSEEGYVLNSWTGATWTTYKAQPTVDYWWIIQHGIKDATARWMDSVPVAARPYPLNGKFAIICTDSTIYVRKIAIQQGHDREIRWVDSGELHTLDSDTKAQILFAYGMQCDITDENPYGFDFRVILQVIKGGTPRRWEIKNPAGLRRILEKEKFLLSPTPPKGRRSSIEPKK